MLDFSGDEYMKSIVVRLRESDILSLQRIVRALCQMPDIGSSMKNDLRHQYCLVAPLSNSLDCGTFPGASTNECFE